MTAQSRIRNKNGGLKPAVFIWMDASLDQLSRKLRSFRLLDGCFSLRSAFASI
jgi:hypothetical protein